MEKDEVTIFEAAVQFENHFIRIDVLKKHGKHLDLIEVKAKSFRSSEEFYTKKGFISSSWKPYLFDVAYQKWVLQNAFPDCTISSYLLLVDKNKYATVDGLNQLFPISKDERGRTQVKMPEKFSSKQFGESILAQVKVDEEVELIISGQADKPDESNPMLHKSFSELVEGYSEAYREDRKLTTPIGKKCKGCEFRNDNDSELKSGYEECWKTALGEEFDISEPSVFEVWNYRSQKALDKGVHTIAALHEDSHLFDMMNERQQLQVTKTVDGDMSDWVKPELRNEMNTWQWPLHFIDFETSAVALPFFEGIHPYESIAFQFSCHTLHKDGNVDHNEWLEATPGKFPNFEFVKALKDILSNDEGTIFRYAAHENTILRKISQQMDDLDPERYAELIEWIDEITEWKIDGEKVTGPRNMVDLCALVQSSYYNPLMKGSNSLKSVLPAIFGSSELIKNKYSKPLSYGTHLQGQVLWAINPGTGKPSDPYKLLPNQYADLDLTQDELYMEDGSVQEGGVALVAYGKLQFTEMSSAERAALQTALLQYCELDTLAMVMLYEHLVSII